MQIIKSFRQNHLVNKSLRRFLKYSSDKIKHSLSPRWRVSGVCRLTVGDINFKMFSDCDDGIVDAIYYGNYSENKELGLFGRLAERSNLILDIGANTGLYSIVSALNNPNAEIWAFEPYSSNLARLRKNLALNGLDKIALFEKAVGDENTTINISVPSQGQICDTVSADEGFSSNFYAETIIYQDAAVKQISLDSLEFARSVDLIKIDVENYELAVFRGAKELLAKHSPVIQCEMFVNDERQDFYRQFLKPLGYYSYMMIESGLVYCENLEPNLDGRDILLTKNKLNNLFTFYSDETLSQQLIPK